MGIYGGGLVRPEVLEALAAAGTPVGESGTVRLYHATSRVAAQAILREGVLRPSQSSDPAQRELMRGAGSVWLSSSPSIVGDLASGDVLLAVDVDAHATPAEITATSEAPGPPMGQDTVRRLDLEVQLKGDLHLAFVQELGDELDQASLEPAARNAIELFVSAQVGQQLADPAEAEGRCKRAGLRFLSALQQAGGSGLVLSWGRGDWWHNAVQLRGQDVVIDWTARQFSRDASYPRLTTVAQAWADFGVPAQQLDPEASAQFFRGNAMPPIMPWDQMRGPVPARDSAEERESPY